MVKIIAEIGQAHDGSLGILHSYIDAAAKAGVDLVKFQTHIAEAESSCFEPFRVNFSYVDNTRFDYWKRMEFTPDQWREIKKHCDDVGVEFLSSPFSVKAVELLENLEVNRYKVASGEVTNKLLLKKLAETNKEILLSTGMSSWNEIDSAVDYLKKFGSKLAVFQCTSEYPVPAERLGLNVISELKYRYNCKVGLSDHSGQIAPSLAAVALGAEFIEAHIVFDRNMFGPDSKSSLTPEEIKKLVEGIRYLETALQSPVNKDQLNFNQYKTIFGKSLAINKDIPAGHKIRFEDLEGKKPANQGIPVSLFESVVGKVTRHPLKKWSFLTEMDLREQ